MKFDLSDMTKQSPQSTVAVTIDRNKKTLSERCIIANRFFTRLKGLIGRKELRDGEAMLFPNCREIHMWFMSIPIDVIFLKSDPLGCSLLEHKSGCSCCWKITSVVKHAKPWKLLPISDWHADATLEVPINSICFYSLTTGDRLCIR